jgi:hypothetical protein
VLEVIRWTIAALGVYLLVGSLAGAVFVVRGVGRVDRAARGTGWGFRVLIVPGCAVFWPLLIARWINEVRRPPPPALSDIPTDDGTTVIPAAPGDPA